MLHNWYIVSITPYDLRLIQLLFLSVSEETIRISSSLTVMIEWIEGLKILNLKQNCSVLKLRSTLHDMDCNMTGSSILCCLPEFAQIHVHESVMLSNHLILCHPFTFCLQSFPESGSFPMSQFFASGGQSPGASASSSVLPMTIQGWFSSELTWSFVSSTKPFLSPLCSPPS